MKTLDIILCNHCKGSGRTSYEVCIDYHKRDYDTILETCKHCDGKGRLLKCTEITYKKID